MVIQHSNHCDWKGYNVDQLRDDASKIIRSYITTCSITWLDVKGLSTSYKINKSSSAQ